MSAAGVHLIDTSLRAGHQIGPLPSPTSPPYRAERLPAPSTLGRGAAPSWLGARVVARLGPASGGYATRAVCDVGRLRVIPDGASDAVAVTMIGTGRTTMAILDRARIGAADIVVVTAAAGGIGSLLVQAARHAGATVVAAVGGPVRVAHARTRGADIVVGYDEASWADTARAELDGRAVTVALDGVGGDKGRQTLKVLGPGGRLLLYGWSSGSATALTSMDLFGRGILRRPRSGLAPHKRRDRYAGSRSTPWRHWPRAR